MVTKAKVERESGKEGGAGQGDQEVSKIYLFVCFLFWCVCGSSSGSCCCGVGGGEMVAKAKAERAAKNEEEAKETKKYK